MNDRFSVDEWVTKCYGLMMNQQLKVSQEILTSAIVLEGVSQVAASHLAHKVFTTLRTKPGILLDGDKITVAQQAGAGGCRPTPYREQKATTDDLYDLLRRADLTEGPLELVVWDTTDAEPVPVVQAYLDQETEQLLLIIVPPAEADEAAEVD